MSDTGVWPLFGSGGSLEAGRGGRKTQTCCLKQLGVLGSLLSDQCK